ncbi:hypothetical protein [Dokdonia sp.]|uniref:hypothetical protein n=1 Tax=Dokdonia sp. TaxID=2024995 RepID=UPI0032641905
MKQLVIAAILLLHFSSFAQNVHDYEYVIVPEQYSFAKNIDEYQLNSLTQFLFNKYGFEAYKVRDQKPAGFQIGDCNALYADIESESNFITAKLKVILKDCNGEVIFISERGRSKEKDFKKAYHDALRKAFLSIEELKYVYSGKNQEDTTTEDVTPTPVIDEKEDVVVKEKTPVKEEVAVVVQEVTSILGSYQSADGFYRLVVEDDNITIYEGETKIGTAIINDNNTYEVLTTQFSGKGKFEANTFVVDRVVKGIGIVQMIFSKN